jgi:hypothetical protein
MEWTLRLVGTGADGQSRSFDVMLINRPEGLGEIANLGLTLSDEVRVKLPRLSCAGCGCGETGVNWLSHCHSTPGLDKLQVRLSALMPYRVATDLLQHVLPIDAGTSPETLRSHRLRVGKRIGGIAAEKPPIVATAITVSLDATFIRSREDGERHLEVRVGNVKTADGGRQVIGVVTRAEADIAALTKRSLETVGRTEATEVTAFTTAVRVCARFWPTRRNDFSLVPYCDAFATHQAGGDEFVDRRPRPGDGEDDDRRRGWTSALAYLEW